MAVTSVAAWSTTAALNTEINGVALGEGQTRIPQFNNIVREMMAQSKAGFQLTDADLTALASAFTAASASGPASLQFAEDTDNGANKVTVIAPASIASDKTATLQDVSGTLALVADIPVAAVQSDQETATSTTTFVNPGRQQFHPSAAKWWAFVSVSGGTPTLTTSYNVTGITDAGVGLVDVTIGTDFSSASWATFGSALDAAGSLLVGSLAKTAGVVSLSARGILAAGALADPTSWSAGGFGDQ